MAAKPTHPPSRRRSTRPIATAFPFHDSLDDVARERLAELQHAMSPAEFDHLRRALDDARAKPHVVTSCPVERALDAIDPREIPKNRRSVSDVRWWWRRYSAPRYKVIEETIDGRERSLGWMPSLDAAGLVKTDARRRRTPADVAKIVRWYFSRETQEALAELDDVDRETVNRGINWLRRQLERLPTVRVIDKPSA
jgi:hypothetical protein